jgi:GNAT superfamily N-acetyltransferase
MDIGLTDWETCNRMMYRNAIPTDAAGIARVHVETWRVAYRGLMPEPVLAALSVARRAIFWERRLAQGAAGIFVAEAEGDIAGFCDVIPSRDQDARAGMVGEIGAFYILPVYWRRGAGRGLCRQAVDEARRLGYRYLTLWVLESNLPAQRFYAAMGFVADGANKTERLEDGSPLHEMRYRIAL